jgi:hypothetical protein
MMRLFVGTVSVMLCLTHGLASRAGERGVSNEAAGEAPPSAARLAFSAPLHRVERQALAQAGVELAEYLGNNQYLALLPPPEAGTALQEKVPFLLSVSPITPREKLSAELRSGQLPAYAVAGDGRFRVRVQMFQSQKAAANQVLSRHSDTVRYDHASASWDVLIQRGKLEALAAEPIVKRVEVVPDPRLL